MCAYSLTSVYVISALSLLLNQSRLTDAVFCSFYLRYCL